MLLLYKSYLVLVATKKQLVFSSDPFWIIIVGLIMSIAKEVYRFSLILRNVDENTQDLEDSLYESGCEDALINSRNGRVYLDFDREAASLEEAIITAIRNVESASIGAVVASVSPKDLVTEL
jgi:hypothetical protein